MAKYNSSSNKGLPYTKKQYIHLSKKKKRQARLGSSDIDTSDLRAYKQDMQRKKAYSWVYKNYS